jgi:hypothetical protein
MEYRMSHPLASFYFVGIIALAAPTAAMAVPTAIVHIADDAMHEIALKKAGVKPKPVPQTPDDPGYLKGTNIPRRTTAPSSN